MLWRILSIIYLAQVVDSCFTRTIVLYDGKLNNECSYIKEKGVKPPCKDRKRGTDEGTAELSIAEDAVADSSTTKPNVTDDTVAKPAVANDTAAEPAGVDVIEQASPGPAKPDNETLSQSKPAKDTPDKLPGSEVQRRAGERTTMASRKIRASTTEKETEADNANGPTGEPGKPVAVVANGTASGKPTGAPENPDIVAANDTDSGKTTAEPGKPESLKVPEGVDKMASNVNVETFGSGKPTTDKPKKCGNNLQCNNKDFPFCVDDICVGDDYDPSKMGPRPVDDSTEKDFVIVNNMALPKHPREPGWDKIQSQKKEKKEEINRESDDNLNAGGAGKPSTNKPKACYSNKDCKSNDFPYCMEGFCVGHLGQDYASIDTNKKHKSAVSEHEGSGKESDNIEGSGKESDNIEGSGKEGLKGGKH